METRRGKHTVSAARRAAFDVLRRVEAEGAFASVLIAELPEKGLSREDRALAQEIALGVLRWRRSLDYFIHRYSRKPVERLDLPVLIALRMGLYQLRNLTRVPASAAVNESVNLVKHARALSAAGFVNAVLRNAARHAGEGAGEGVEGALERFSVEVSHPPWMLERWVAMLGEDEARQLALANNEPPPVAFRVNTLRADAVQTVARLRSKGVAVRPSSSVPEAFVVEGGPVGALFELVESGAVYLQDEASQLVSLILEPERGDRILDLCAAPGSKTSHIAALTAGAAWVVACDLHPHRAARLAAACRRLGASTVDALASDCTRNLPIEAGQKFDRVLVDAPCTGTGTLRRHPEIKWRLAAEDVSRMAEVQLSLLSNGASAVAERGRIVYSTCSVEPEENEEVVRQFLNAHASFRQVRPEAHDDLVTPEGFVRTFPHRHATDGFFAAVLEKV